MKVETQQLYKCDICGKVSEWNENWSSHLFPFDIRSDMTFHVCSEYCDKRLLHMGKAKRKNLFIKIQNSK